MSRLRTTPPAVHVDPRPLADLVAALPGGAAGEVVGDADVLVSDVQIDSRAVTPGTLFGAVRPDTHTGRDGHDFVDDALARGAVAALVSDEWLAARADASSAPAPLGKGRPSGAAWVPATDTRAALGGVAAAFYGRPADALTTLGVTGTNGKTTTVFLLHHLVTALGVQAGLVGTVENRIGTDRYATAFTTPEAPALQRFLRACVDGGCTAAAMEVSSHGLALSRVGGIAFDVAVFTNLTQDHLDYHETFEAYRDAKKLLFDGLSPGATAVVNGDDPEWRRMTADTAAHVVTFGTSPDVDVPVEVLDNGLDGLRLRLGGEERTFSMTGRFNALNLAASYACGLALGHGGGAVLDALAAAPGVPGRFETVRGGDVVGIVDYAHTPDALDNVLRTAREIVPEGSALWIVTGSGGDRDRTKRPRMARVAETLADRVVITQDNPRTEDPDRIVADLLDGLDRPDDVTVLQDRAEAIGFVAREAAAGDVVVVAGKGHETTQSIGGETRPFDDRVVLRDALTSRPAR